MEPRRAALVWKISPGKHHHQWGVWMEKSVMAIGWECEDEVGNLARFPDISSLRQALKDAGDLSPGYAAEQCWAFCNGVQVGDIVVSYGGYHILGIGRVEGDYYYKWDTLAKDSQLYGSRRKVSWLEMSPMEVGGSKNRRFLSKNRTLFQITERTMLRAIRGRYEKIQNLVSQASYDPVEPFFADEEGRRSLRTHVIAERSPGLIRAFKRSLNSFDCKICGFNFRKVYGPLGREFIEAHHVKPVASLKPDEKVALKDLTAVCSNCHRMLHRRNPPLKPRELREMLSSHARQ